MLLTIPNVPVPYAFTYLCRIVIYKILITCCHVLFLFLQNKKYTFYLHFLRDFGQKKHHMTWKMSPFYLILFSSGKQG